MMADKPAAGSPQPRLDVLLFSEVNDKHTPLTIENSISGPGLRSCCGSTAAAMVGPQADETRNRQQSVTTPHVWGFA